MHRWSEALLDTGFDGGIAIPAGRLDISGEPDTYEAWRLADGSRQAAPVYRGTVRIGDLEPIRVLVTVLGDEILMGREVSDLFHVTLDRGTYVVFES